MDIQKALQELANKIKEEIARRISAYGTNSRGENTLKGSNLEASIDVKVMGDDELVFQIADYYQAVVLGWHGFTGRYPHTWSKAIDNISKWAIKHGLVGEGKNANVGEGKNANQVAYAIFKAIQKRGIQGRPFLGVDTQAGERIGEPAVGDPSIVLPFLDKFFDEWFDSLFESITNELDKYFNNAA